MAEVTLANFRVGQDSVYDIGAVGDGPGVVDEVMTAFGYKGRDLEELTALVAPNPKLQQNIDHAIETLTQPGVTASLGYEPDTTAAEIAHGWGTRAGLQAEVFRPIMEPVTEDAIPDSFDVAIETDAVVRWMIRMGGVAIAVARQAEIQDLILVSADRAIGPDEHPDVAAGTKAHDYMTDVLLPMIGKTGLFGRRELIATQKKKGNDVMALAAAYLSIRDDIDLETARVIMPAVAGNWAQKGVQARQAFQRLQPEFDTDPSARQLWVATIGDNTPLGKTGKEPKATHQNPFSAIGGILRAATLLEKLA